MEKRKKGEKGERMIKEKEDRIELKEMYGKIFFFVED